MARAKERERVVVAPRTAEEITVTELWSSVLDVEEVSVDDDFFAWCQRHEVRQGELHEDLLAMADIVLLGITPAHP